MGRGIRRAFSLALSLICALTMLPAGIASAAGSSSGHPAARPNAPVAPGDCPTIMPVASLHAGQKGIGWTVEQGQRREAFKVKVLDVLTDGIAPGLDLIVVKVNDTPGNDMIARAGGIWAGMSGSPVYVNGQLIGAVSYGFSFSPSRIGGLTPAEDIARLLDYPTASAAAQSSGKVHLPDAAARRVAAAGHMSVQRASSMKRLPVPVSVSASKQSRTRLQKRFDAAGLDVIVTAGRSAQAPSGSSAFDTPQAGGNFAGVLSYGDVTAAAVGTTTYVCGDQALAFGHPLNFAGKVTYGANNATAVTVIRDDLGGSYKMAQVGGAFGTVDQDRLAGIRTQLGRAVPLIPVTTDFTAPNIGRHRVGETDVTMSLLVPGLAAEHLFQNLVVTFDQRGAGSALVHWTVNGTDASGDAWSLDRTNRFSTDGDIASTVADDFYFNLAALFQNGFEQVTFDSISADASVVDTVDAVTVEDVLISKNGGPFKHRPTLKVHPGTDLVIRVMLKTFDGATTSQDLHLTVPADAFGPGTLVVQGTNGGFSDCVFVPSSCGSTFDELLSALADAPRNDEVVAQLYSFDAEFNPTVVAEDAAVQDSTVNGGMEIQVNIQ